METKEECAPAGDSQIEKKGSGTVEELSKLSVEIYVEMHLLSNENNRMRQPCSGLRGKRGILADQALPQEWPGIPPGNRLKSLHRGARHSNLAD